MPRYFTEELNQGQLEKKIQAALIKKISKEDLEEFKMNEDTTRDINEFDALSILSYACGGYFNGAGIILNLTEKISKDLSKVNFDIENFSYGNDFNNSGLCGYQTLENGLTFLGFEAGGYWEFPVFSIIYWDGKKLRGYIPEDGNPWNTETKMAYGNDYEGQYKDNKGTDENNMQKRFGTREMSELSFDYKKIIADIEERIQKK